MIDIRAMTSSSGPHVESRNVTLRSEAAALFLQQRGWSLAWPDARIAGDTMPDASNREPQIAISRYWHTPLRAQLPAVSDAASSSEPVLGVSLFVMGAATIRVGESSVACATGEGVVLNPSHRIEYSTSVATASITLSLRSRLLSEALGPLEAPRRFSSDSPAGQSLISVVNSIFEYPHAQGEPEFQAVKRALVYLTIATTRRSLQEEGRCSLVERARMLMASEVEDPDFTVARLAQMAGVSSTILNGAFQAVGSTPSREIRATRVRRARMLLDEDRSLTQEVVARRAGFGSVRSLQRALAGDVGSSDRR